MPFPHSLFQNSTGVSRRDSRDEQQEGTNNSPHKIER